jgi:acetolactate synthase I/II/III large subunit
MTQIDSSISQRIMAEAHEQGLRYFFGLPGGGAPLEMIDTGGRLGISFVPVAHESSAAIMAGYYGLMKGTAGLALAIRGVGAGNLAGGVVNAFFERLPLIAICESTPVSPGDRTGVQQCDQNGLFAGVAKFQADLAASNVEALVRDAFRVAVEGRPGPVILGFPSDAEAIFDRAYVPVSGSPLRPRPAGDLQAARDFLARCARPVVIAGADIIRGHAIGELRDLVEAAGAAVLVTMEARGVFPESHPRWAGVLTGVFNKNVIETRVLDQADGVLMAGVDAAMTHGPWKHEIPCCEATARSEYRSLHPGPAVRVSGDLKAMLRILTPPPRPGFAESEVRRLREDILLFFRRPPGARFAAQDVIEITRKLLPADGILFSETGAYICMLEHLWLVDKPGTYFGTSGGRSMGLTLPAAIGARLADPATPMVGIGGDGSLLMRLGELETMARTGAAFPLVIINDQALGTIKWRQKSRGFPDRGLDLYPVDFAAVAAACGLRGVMAQTPEEFESALGSALRSRRATLIDARVDPVAYQDGFGATIGAGST